MSICVLRILCICVVVRQWKNQIHNTSDTGTTTQNLSVRDPHEAYDKDLASSERYQPQERSEPHDKASEAKDPQKERITIEPRTCSSSKHRESRPIGSCSGSTTRDRRGGNPQRDQHPGAIQKRSVTYSLSQSAVGCVHDRYMQNTILLYMYVVFLTFVV